MAEEFEDWKPMSEDFDSILVNSYSNGQIGGQLPLKRTSYFRLFVDRFPSDLTEPGITTFLKRIGCKLLSVKKIRSKGHPKPFAVVDFETLRDARNAIEMINRQNNYNLLVSFISTETETKEKKQLIDNELKEFKDQLLRQREESMND